jgi:hypothetical protein
MQYLMHICFDNDHRLARKHYLFEYKGVRFKLVQNNPRKWADHLLTLLPDYSEETRDAAFQMASEFLSALSWHLRSRIMVWECGGRSWHSPLGKAQPSVFHFPRIPFRGQMIGCHLHAIPNIEHEYQKTALTLFREASAANNDYLSFLFYWQVLECRNTKASNYVNSVYTKKHKEFWLKLREHDIALLALGDRTLGQYLRNDCRHAIAHIRRKPGEKVLELDSTVERERMSASTRVIQAFAKHYIENAIGLRSRMYLVRKHKGSFPVFVDEKTRAETGYKTAYEWLRSRTAS